MNDVFLGVIAMLTLGSMPALTTFIPRAGEDIAIVRAPWAPNDAALRAAIAMEGSIMRVFDENGTVIVRPSGSNFKLKRKLPAGVFILRGSTPLCGPKTAQK
jgi:hypothetical protein